MKIKDVKVFEPNVYKDFRGDLWTIWKEDEFNPKLNFNHDKVSTSRKGVLRGVHGDKKSYKLLTCLQGELYFVIVDNRPNSSTYLEWDWLILDDSSRKQVLLPPGVGNGFLVLSESSIFHYKWCYEGKYPDVEDQFTIKWDNKDVNIYWPIDNPILQKRDK